MFDESGLIDIRTKEINMRLLNRPLINSPKNDSQWVKEKTFWQLFNTILPVLMVFLFGVINYFIRKYKYTRS
jgi:ABC-2 type transport system permease protein